MPLKAFIKIRGRGIIDGLPWYVGLNRSDYVDVQNLKIVANRHDPAPPPGQPLVNGGMAPDGFRNFNTSHVTIADSFIRTDDDCIAPIISWTPTPLTDGLTVTRTTLWTDRANIWRIGSGFQGLGVPSPAMKNMWFTDLDVIHYDPAWNPAATRPTSCSPRGEPPDTQLPAVSITAPAGGATVSGTLTISGATTKNLRGLP